MGRSNQNEILRTLILRREKSGVKGVMGLEEVMREPKFNGWHKDEIRRMVQQLGKKYRGQDEGEGEEFWAIYHGVIFGLTKSVPQWASGKLTHRDEQKQATTAARLIQTHSVLAGAIKHDGVLHKQEIKNKLQTSDKHLEATVEASQDVIDTLVKYKGEFDDTSQ